MAVFNAAKREIDLKIVYYGPAMCGKTTNVQCIHKMLAPQQRGELMSLATKDDRTLFFDFLPIELGDVRGFKTRFHIYTVPGQVYYALTRRAVLTGADGVVFVADSQTNKLQDNIDSLKDLAENLRFYKKDLTAFPFVMQYNKRDLPNIMPVDELNSMLNTLNVPSFGSSAVTGMGVVETLTAICKIVLKQMDSGTAKKKPLPPSAASKVAPPLSAAATEDLAPRIFPQQPTVAAPPSRTQEQAQPVPPKAPPAPGRAAPAAPSFARQPEPPSPPPGRPVPGAPPQQTTAFRLQPSGPAAQPQKEVRPSAPEPVPKFAPPAAEPSFSFADDSFGGKKSFDEDASSLSFEEPAEAGEEPELSFDEEASGLDFEEPALEQPVLSFDEEASGLDFDEPATAEPDLSFDEDASDLSIEEPAMGAAVSESAFEEDASSLMLDEEEPLLDETLTPMEDTEAFALEEPATATEEPAYTFDKLPAFDETFSMPGATASPVSIVSCGQPQKVSATVVKLPITLKSTRDNTEYPITVTINIECGSVK